MRKFFVLVALLLAGSGVVWADAIPMGVAADSTPRRTRVVFNNAGSALTSGSVVVWDNDKVSFDRSGNPYVTTTTTTDSPWVAGVTLDPSCADQSLCEIVVEGWAWTRVAQALDVTAEDTAVATSARAGMAGDYGPAANTCLLGILAENYNKETTATSTVDGAVFPVFVNITCQ